MVHTQNAGHSVSEYSTANNTSIGYQYQLCPVAGTNGTDYRICMLPSVPWLFLHPMTVAVVPLMAAAVLLPVAVAVLLVMAVGCNGTSKLRNALHKRNRPLVQEPFRVASCISKLYNITYSFSFSAVSEQLWLFKG